VAQTKLSCDLSKHLLLLHNQRHAFNAKNIHITQVTQRLDTAQAELETQKRAYGTLNNDLNKVLELTQFQCCDRCVAKQRDSFGQDLHRPVQRSEYFPRKYREHTPDQHDAQVGQGQEPAEPAEPVGPTKRKRDDDRHPARRSRSRSHSRSASASGDLTD
jgi:hypothetical protein